MQVLTDLAAFQKESERPLVLGLGNFDGVHLGHQALLKKVVEKSKKYSAHPAVFTFSEHPQAVLQPDSKLELLTQNEHKLFLLQEIGIRVCFLIHFTQEFSQMQPEDFIKKIFVEKLDVKAVCLGYNARFGRARKGGADLMKKMAQECGFDFEEVGPVRVENEVVSSSIIRNLISAGDFEKAAKFLGRPFSLLSRVTKGSGRGAQIGFPTANLETQNLILPEQGVYPVKVHPVSIAKEAITPHQFKFNAQADSRWREGVLNYGKRPTFDSKTTQSVAEVFILDFQEDLYDKTLEVVFYPKLRSEKKFESVESLKQQIQQDIARAREFFKAKK